MCKCSGCAGETVTIDPACTSESSCSGSGSRLSYRNGYAGSGCDYCSGPDGTCMPNAAALSACTYIKPGISISSSGLISAAGDNPGSGGNVCNRCLGSICNLPGSAENSIDLASGANLGAMCEACNECETCNACQYQQLTCPEDSAAASLGSGALGTTLLAVGSFSELNNS